MVALWLTSCLVLIFVAKADAALGATCRFPSQCSRGECCTERFMIASKRQVDGNAIRGPFPGNFKTCQRILTEGQSCGIFASPCGCATGLRCVTKANASPAPVEATSQRLIIGPGGSQSTCVKIGKF